MDITISPGKLRGSVDAIPSKSQAHRLLICAAFADNPTQLRCPDTNQDIEATVDCLRALGANILRTESGYTIFPIGQFPETAVLNCRESGSTLRFLLPIVAALGVDAIFQMEGRLPQRPLSPLWEELERMGAIISRPTPDTLRCQGKLQPGAYSIPGNVSSQYVTGLLYALSLIDGESSLSITGQIESKPYIDMTKQAMSLFSAPKYHSPSYIEVEGDWSNGAFFLTAQMLDNPITVSGLNEESFQGDRAVLEILKSLKQKQEVVSARDIPDLIPILSVFAACNHGAVFTDIQRLRIKESDRVASTIAMIENLGGKAESIEDTLTISGTGLIGGIVDAMNDHRIAMSAAIASTRCRRSVTILGAECVKKSYPRFWEEFSCLGGNYEQYLR